MSFMARLRALERDTPASVGVTPGTAHGNSSLVLDSAKDATGIGNLSGTKWTGLVVGNVTGILTGNSTGVHTGNVAGNVAGAVGNFTGNVTGGNLSIGGVAAVTGNLSGGNISSAGACAITGNFSGGNISTAGIVSATGNVSGGNITSGGAAVITGNVSGGNVTTAGVVAATGNVSGGNITSGGAAAITGNISGGNISTGGVLSVTGLATLTLMPRLAESNINAAGTVVGNATQIVAGFVTVAAADGTKGAVLPATPATGTWVAVKNNSASVLKVYPDAAATINAIGSNGPISMAANTSAIFFADSTTQWWTIPLLPS